MPSTSVVTFTWRGEEWQRAVVPAIEAGLTRAAMVMANQAVLNLSKNAPPSAPGDFPGHDLSVLRNSIAFASPATLGTPLHAAFGTAVRYGRVHEFGAIITAKTKKLKVPINRQLARQAERNHWPLVLIKRDGRPPLLARLLGTGRTSRRTRSGNYSGGERVEPIFVLKDSVRIPARPWVRRSATMAREAAQAAFVAAASAQLKAAGLVQRRSRG